METLKADHKKALDAVNLENENLQAEVAGLKEEISAKVDAHTADQEALNGRIEELQTQLEACETVNAALQAEIEKLDPKALRAGRAATATEPAKLTLPSETFSVDDQAYRFVAPVFVHKGQRITAEAALKDEALQAQLVADGAGVITTV